MDDDYLYHKHGFLHKFATSTPEKDFNSIISKIFESGGKFF